MCKLCTFDLRRLLLILRRHLHLGHHLRRVLRNLDVLQEIRALDQGLEVHLALHLLHSVTAKTILFHHEARLVQIKQGLYRGLDLLGLL